MKSNEELINSMLEELSALNLLDTQVDEQRTLLQSKVEGIFKKTILAADKTTCDRLNRQVKLLIHPDKLSGHSKKQGFLHSFSQAPLEIQTLVIHSWDDVFNIIKALRSLATAGIIEIGTKLRPIISARFKKYPKEATEDELSAIDAANLEMIIFLRDSINSTFLNITIDLLYQYYRYPESINSPLYVASLTVNALLLLSLIPLVLTQAIIGRLRMALETFYLYQLNDHLKRKAYVYVAKYGVFNTEGDIDDSGANDADYTKDCEQLLRETWSEEKWNICSKQPFFIDKKGYRAIYKHVVASPRKMIDDNEQNDDFCETQVKNYFSFHDPRKELFNAELNTLNFQGKTDDSKTKELYRPVIMAQAEEAEFEHYVLSQNEILGLKHFLHVCWSIFEGATQPLAEDNLFKSIFLRILRLCIAFPAALLISLPLSFALEICSRLMQALLFTVVSLKLLSAFVFALPLFMGDAVAWACRRCFGQPEPQADKDRFFKYAAKDMMFWTLKQYDKPESKKIEPAAFNQA